MRQPQVLAPVPQHNKVGCSSNLHWDIPRSFVSHPPLPFLRGSVRGRDWGAVFSPRVGSVFPRPSSLRAGLGQPPSTLAMCFRPCWPREAAVQCHSRAALSPGGMFTRTPLSPVRTHSLCPFPTPLRQLFPTCGRSAAMPQGTPCPREGSLAQHLSLSRGAAVVQPGWW